MSTQTTWENYSAFTEARGELVYRLVKKHTAVQKQTVLDIGCGEGGTASVLAQNGATVTAIDVHNNFRYPHPSIHFQQFAIEHFRCANELFDIIVMQDVLEHLPDGFDVFAAITPMLKNNGIFFLSTPNRLSPLNVIADPHWDLPLVSLLPRRYVKILVSHIYRKDRRDRKDWAALVSFFKLRKMLKKNQFYFIFKNKEVVHYMIENPESVLCNPWHLKFVSVAMKLGFDIWLRFLINNKQGLLNYFINPTWYIIGWKNNSHHHCTNLIENDP